MALKDTYTQGYELQNWLRGTCLEGKFSREALDAIANYYDELGEDVEIDIAIFNEFEEASKEEIISNFDLGLDENASDDELLEELGNYTFAQLLGNGNFLYINF